MLALDPVEVLPGAEDEARAWLESNRPDVKDSVDHVLSLIHGWENAYGMELLATVLFAARQDSAVLTDANRAVEYVRSWNRRKASTFPRQHVDKAWHRLSSYDWLTGRES